MFEDECLPSCGLTYGFNVKLLLLRFYQGLREAHCWQRIVCSMPTPLDPSSILTIQKMSISKANEKLAVPLSGTCARHGTSSSTWGSELNSALNLVHRFRPPVPLDHRLRKTGYHSVKNNTIVKPALARLVIRST